MQEDDTYFNFNQREMPWFAPFSLKLCPKFTDWVDWVSEVLHPTLHKIGRFGDVKRLHIPPMHSKCKPEERGRHPWTASRVLPSWTATCLRPPGGHSWSEKHDHIWAILSLWHLQRQVQDKNSDTLLKLHSHLHGKQKTMLLILY